MKRLKPYLLYSLILLFLPFGNAQSGFHLQGNTGLGLNPTISLNGNKLKNAYSTIFDFSTTYQFRLFRKIYSEIGLGGRYLFSSGKLGELSYTAHTLKMQMPLNLVYQLSHKWGVATGLLLRNTKEVLDSDFREKYFWRLGLTGEGRYFWKPKWSLTFGFSYELRDIPKGYFVDDPKTAVLFGLRHKI